MNINGEIKALRKQVKELNDRLANAETNMDRKIDKAFWQFWKKQETKAWK